MAITQGEIDMVLELFEPLAPIKYRKMMGGLTIYAADVTFAIYDPDEGYYLKSDDQTHHYFEDEGLSKFEFAKKDGSIATMNYFPMPERCYDDPEELEVWARRSLDVALRAKAKKKPKKKRT